MEDEIFIPSPNLLEEKKIFFFFLFPKSNWKSFKESVILSNISDLCALPFWPKPVREFFSCCQILWARQWHPHSISLDKTQAAPIIQIKKKNSFLRPFLELSIIFFNWYWHYRLLIYFFFFLQNGPAKGGSGGQLAASQKSLQLKKRELISIQLQTHQRNLSL